MRIFRELMTSLRPSRPSSNSAPARDHVAKFTRSSIEFAFKYVALAMRQKGREPFAPPSPRTVPFAFGTKNIRRCHYTSATCTLFHPPPDGPNTLGQKKSRASVFQLCMMLNNFKVMSESSMEKCRWNEELLGWRARKVVSLCSISKEWEE